MYRYLLLLFICFGFPLESLAQDSKLGNWWIYFGNKTMNSKWNWHHEVQYRNYNVIGDLEQLLLRTGIGYNLSENNNNLLLGYGFIHSQNYHQDAENKLEVDEHRIYQQFINRHKAGRSSVQHRFRFEERFVENDFRMRFRYFLSVNIPLSEENKWYLSAYNEIFLNTEEEYFDRDRLYGGLGHRFSEILRLEAGYMNQFLNGSHRDQLNLIAFLNF